MPKAQHRKNWCASRFDSWSFPIPINDFRFQVERLSKIVLLGDDSEKQSYYYVTQFCIMKRNFFKYDNVIDFLSGVQLLLLTFNKLNPYSNVNKNIRPDAVTFNIIVKKIKYLFKIVIKARQKFYLTLSTVLWQGLKYSQLTSIIIYGNNKRQSRAQRDDPRHWRCPWTLPSLYLHPAIDIVPCETFLYQVRTRLKLSFNHLCENIVSQSNIGIV